MMSHANQWSQGDELGNSMLSSRSDASRQDDGSPAPSPWLAPLIARPSLSPAPVWTLPTPTVTPLGNGMTLWTYDLPGQHVAAATLILPIRLTSEPRELEGIAELTAHTLDESTLDHPGESYAEAMEDVGATYSASVGHAATHCFLDAPVTTLPAALRLFAEAIERPELADDDVERLRIARLAAIQHQRANGSSLAALVIRETVVEASHRSSRPSGGTIDTVSAIAPADVRTFHAAHYGPAGATLIIAGDLSDLDARAAAEEAFGSWSAPVEASAIDTPVAAAPRRRLIDRSGAVQSDVRLGWPGIDRADPRWPALQVACCALGGLFNSRLNHTLREDLGYTYGISLAPHPFRSGGLVLLGCSVRNEVTAGALAAIERIVALPTPFSDEEIAAATTYLTDSAPLHYATAESVAEQAGLVAALGLDVDQVSHDLDRIRQVTAAEATGVYREIVRPEATNVVVVGDATALTTPLGIEPETIDVEPTALPGDH